MFIFGVAVSWESKKHGYVARDTQEAEYVACSMVATHVVWIRRILLELNLNLIDGPIEIYRDNMSTIDLIYNGANSSKGQTLIYNFIIFMM